MMRKTTIALLLVGLCVSTGCRTKKPGQCSKDRDCKTGERCVAGKCQQCGENSHCPKGKTCVNGQCRKKPGYCESHKDCPDGKACIDHLCQSCRSDKDCAGGRCVGGRCVESMTGTCKIDDDCKDDEICKNGRCVAAPKPYTGPSLCGLKTVYFAFNRSEIRQSDLKKLQENAKCIQSVKTRRIHLNGHCDPRGTEEYNLALSNRRAQAVKRYLESLGVNGERLHVVPKGELEATGTDETSWSNDRKVEFVWY